MQINNQWKIAASAPESFAFDLMADKRLVGVEAVELDSSGNAQYDIVTIALAYTNGAGINLKVGNIGQGSTLRWQGDLLVQQPIKLVVQFFNPTAGNTLRVNWHTCEIGEPVASGDSNQAVVQTFPLGRPKIVNVDGAAGVTPQLFRPAANLQWLVVGAVGLHDEAAPIDVGWSITDGTIYLSMTRNTLPATTKLSISNNNDLTATALQGNLFTNPLMLTNKVYGYFSAPTLNATKHLFIRGYVYEFAGGD